MPDKDPFAVFFGDLTKLGPSSSDVMVEILRILPSSNFETIVDAGCGTGAQTLTLAAQLQKKIHALDNNQSFLDTLMERAEKSGLGNLIETHCLDLSDLGSHLPQIDLLWSEGAAYCIGFETALKAWKDLLTPTGVAVISELCWIHEAVPQLVQDYFAAGYPAMKSIDENVSLIESNGFKILAQHTLPPSSWTDGYYDILKPRAETFLNHKDEALRELAQEMIEEVDAFNQSNGCYSYVIFALQTDD